MADLDEERERERVARADRLAAVERQLAEEEAVRAEADEEQALSGDDRHRALHLRAAVVHRTAQQAHEEAARVQQDHADHIRSQRAN